MYKMQNLTQYVQSGWEENVNRRLSCTNVEPYCAASLETMYSEILEHALCKSYFCL
jgi:hypothetical protein